MKAIGVIPARFASTRFPGKVLALLAGKPMIQHVWERVMKCVSLDEVIIACDDPKVLQTAQEFGARAVMTRIDHPSGSDRIAEVVGRIHAEIVVNIQGDEPLIDPHMIDSLVEALKEDEGIAVSTVIKRIENEEDLKNPNVVKVVIDQNRHALYFSRSCIPYNRNKERLVDTQYYKHLGIYAYRKNFLMSYKDWSKSMLEKTEQLEQLRILEAGYRVKTIETNFETIGVDTPQDLAKAEEFLKKGKR